MGFTEILSWVIMGNQALVGIIVMYIMYYMVMDLNNNPLIHYTTISNALKLLYITVGSLFALTLLHQVLIT